MLTGGTSGVYYPLGVALSTNIGKALPNVKTSVQATKASVENLNLLQTGRGEIAFTLGDSLSDAWKGNEEAGFKTPLNKLRGIAAIYPNYIQIVARADSGIRSLADLKGKRISVGAPRSGTELNARTIFEAAGITYKDFSKVEYLPFGESVELMKNRQLDVTLQSAGPRRREPARPRDLGRHRRRADSRRRREEDQRPGLHSGDDSREHLQGPDRRRRFGHGAELPRHPRGRLERHRVRDDQGAVDRPRQPGRRPLGRQVHRPQKRALEGMPLPLHPGAEKYYKEVGVLK